MSWDVLLLNVPANMTSLSDGELPEEFTFTLGSHSNVTAALDEAIPEIQHLDSAWARVRNNDFSIEIQLGNEDPVPAIVLHIYGEGNDIITIIEAICLNTGWRAFDTSTDRFIDFTIAPTEGFDKYKAYKNKIKDFIKKQSE
jgi:hypothetical protein